MSGNQHNSPAGVPDDSGFWYADTAWPGGGKKKKNNKKHHRRVINPCNQPPSVPTNVAFLATAREAETHLRFFGRVRWDEVTTAIDGMPTEIATYEAQWVACDATGVPVEHDVINGKVWNRARRKDPMNKVIVRNATNPSGSTGRFTTRQDHGFAIGDKVRIVDMEPAAYNEATTTITAVPAANIFEANIGTSGVANSTKNGRVIDDDDWLHILTGRLEKPKSVYWKARVRARDVDDRWSAWSAWTTPFLPWTGANPKPPTVTGVILTWDVLERSKWDRVRAVITWNEIVNFDYPGTPADDEDDLDSYEIQLQSSTDGANGHWPPRSKVRKAKQVSDPGAGGNDASCMFKAGIKKKFFYRARVRGIDRFNRRGDWGNWTAWASPNDNVAPPEPFNVQAWVDQSRIQVRWDAQNEQADEDLPNEDTAWFVVQVSKNTSFSPLLFKERRVAESFSHKIQKPNGFYYVRVRAVDSSYNKSGFAYNGGGSAPGAPAAPQNPNAPTVSINFDAGGPRRSRFRALVNVTPGAAFADEEDLHYRVQFVHKAVNGTPTAADRRRRGTMETDDDSLLTFPNIRKSHFTFARGRTIDRQGRQSPWSNWVAGGQPSVSGLGIGPPTNLNIESGPRRIQANWDPPAGVEDAENVVEYKVEVWQGGTLKKTRRTHNDHYRYMIPKADRNLNHNIRVYARDDLGTESSAGITGNGLSEKLDETDLEDAFSQSATKTYSFNGNIRLGDGTTANTTGAFQTGDPAIESIISLSRNDGKDTIRFKNFGPPASQTLLAIHADGIRWGSTDTTRRALLAQDATLQLSKDWTHSNPTGGAVSGTSPNVSGVTAAKLFIGNNDNAGTMALKVKFVGANGVSVIKLIAHNG